MCIVHNLRVCRNHPHLEVGGPPIGLSCELSGKGKNGIATLNIPSNPPTSPLPRGGDVTIGDDREFSMG